MWCLYVHVAENMTKRPLSISGGLTVLFKAVKSHPVKVRQINFSSTSQNFCFHSFPWTLQQFVKFPRWSMQTAKFSQG